MLKKFGYILGIRNKLSSFWSLQLGSIESSTKLSLSGTKCELCGIKFFHSCNTLNGDFKKMYEKEGKWKRKIIDIEGNAVISSTKSYADSLPDENLPTKVFNGIMYQEIPIVNIRVSPNNAIFNLTDFKGLSKLIWSCGLEGFKNAKKGTNLAAQATALTFSRKALDMGFKTVRVRIQGIGPGRMSSVRGLAMGGLDVISVTDNTRVSDNPARGKKLRRV